MPSPFLFGIKATPLPQQMISSESFVLFFTFFVKSPYLRPRVNAKA